MLNKSQKISNLKLEMENLQLQMQNELLALNNKKSIFLSPKIKEKKQMQIIDFYSNQIADKTIEIELLQDEEN